LVTPATEGEILAIASDEKERRRLAFELSSLGPVRPVLPSGLQRRESVVEAAAAVAILDGETPDALEDLLPLRELPVGRRLVIVIGDVDDAILERAIEVLTPLHLVARSMPGGALRFAVRRALAARDTGARRPKRAAPSLLGVSVAIREVREQIRHLAPSGLPVLVLGETGTGKELVARSLHEESLRSDGPFVAVNCGALPETLLESELFGFRRGAFTGADRSKGGLFEQANGGTLFLDEVGDTSAPLQVKLLRAIEAQEVRPLGSTEAVHVDVRVVSATNRSLEEAGSFRQDLLYRLNTATLHMPPLRERRVDIPLLARHFAEEFGEAHRQRVALAEDLIEALTRLDFPGNARELRNVVERAIAFTRPGETVTADCLARLPMATAPRSLPSSGTLRDRIQQVEIAAIRDALVQFDGNRTRVAEALGLSRVGLRQKMRRLGLDGDPKR
jgi:transcriptional regulator with PAS, ATPase and Fis domain